MRAHFSKFLKLSSIVRRRKCGRRIVGREEPAIYLNDLICSVSRCEHLDRVLYSRFRGSTCRLSVATYPRNIGEEVLMCRSESTENGKRQKKGAFRVWRTGSIVFGIVGSSKLMIELMEPFKTVRVR